MSERMSEPERGVNRKSPEREPNRVEPEPVLSTSAQIINEIEEHYFRPELPTSEYAAVRDHVTQLEAASYIVDKANKGPVGEFATERGNQAASNVDKRRKAGVYGKEGEKMDEAVSFQRKLTQAYYIEGVEVPEAWKNVRVVFSRIRNRLESPPSQPSQVIPAQTPQGK